MNVTKRSRIILLTLAFLSLVASSFAQSREEVDLLRSFNPVYKRNNNIRLLSQTAQPVAIAIPFGILVAALINDNKASEMKAYEIGTSIVIAAVATEGIKMLVKRPRPYQTYDDIYPDEVDNGNSFPSNHTSMVFATATSLALNYKKWYITIPAFGWASAVGYSRMYLGQHYPSDVLAGAAVGIGSAYAARWLNKKFFGKRKAARNSKLSLQN